MIAIIIATLVCATIVLTAYWLRDLALRWLDEGRAVEQVERLRAEMTADREALERAGKAQYTINDSLGDSIKTLGERDSILKERLNEIEALARRAEASVREKNVGAALRGTGRS
jgi:hypothetical protein